MMKILLAILLLNLIIASAEGEMIQLRPSQFRNLSRFGRGRSPFSARPLEPTCEDLKAMWRFSTRQSRASELTNKLPMYKDPFAYNIWLKYPDMRYLANPRRTTGLMRSRPVYGRVVYEAPSDHPRVLYPDPPKQYGVIRYYEPTAEEEARRNFGLAATFGAPNRRQKGSFDRLKELVFAERMKERNNQQHLLANPVSGNNSPKPAFARPPVPSPPPVVTPHPPTTPPPAGAPLLVKEEPLHVSGPYEAAFRGEQNPESLPPNIQDRLSRVKIVTGYYNQNNREDIGADDDDIEDDEDELPNEDAEYGPPDRLKDAFIKDEPYFDF